MTTSAKFSPDEICADAAATRAHAAWLPQDLEVEPLHLAAIGEEVTMAAVVAEHDVARAIERRDDTGGDCFLANASVRRTGQRAGCEQVEQRLLEEADAGQQRVELGRRRGAVAHVQRERCGGGRVSCQSGVPGR